MNEDINRGSHNPNQYIILIKCIHYGIKISPRKIRYFCFLKFTGVQVSVFGWNIKRNPEGIETTEKETILIKEKVDGYSLCEL